MKDGSWIFDLGGRNLRAFAHYQPEIYKNVRFDVRMVNKGDPANSVNLICRYSEREGWYQYEVFNSSAYNLFYFGWDEDMKAVRTLLTNGISDAMRRGPARARQARSAARDAVDRVKDITAGRRRFLLDEMPVVTTFDRLHR